MISKRVQANIAAVLARPRRRPVSERQRAWARKLGKRYGKMYAGKARPNIITCWCLKCAKCKNRIKVRKWRARRRFDITPLLSKAA